MTTISARNVGSGPVISVMQLVGSLNGTPEQRIDGGGGPQTDPVGEGAAIHPAGAFEGGGGQKVVLPKMPPVGVEPEAIFGAGIAPLTGSTDPTGQVLATGT